MSKALKRAKNIFLYSDSEPNELLIAFCHMFALPASILFEFQSDNHILCLIAIFAGSFQMWAVVFNGSLKYRLYAVQMAALVAIFTVENLIAEGLLNGSRVGWIIIALFAIWNTIRVFKEKISRGL